MKKITKSLTQEQEDEAIACWNQQVDQTITSAEKAEEYGQLENVFWFVFGYAHAKGWTSVKQRMSPK